MRSQDCIGKNDSINPSSFSFNRVDHRSDYMEASIYWDDDENAVDFAKNHASDRDGSIRNACGIAVLKTTDLVSIKKNPAFEGNFMYEKRFEEGNPYHGNLLLKSEAEKVVRQQASAVLAYYARLLK